MVGEAVGKEAILGCSCDLQVAKTEVPYRLETWASRPPLLYKDEKWLFCFETGFHYVAQACLKFTIVLLPQAPEWEM